ncbi:hypothetical protein BDN70DRAFT_879143 [Pholiota conissans]|uniref:BTB domain-containing protein n=1 Tax=Pholiota conissans TaxID=109636 RepID=A0A9P5Z0V3_9AGAR|nr:hypothetical protein BDN70DRAFT_879143 [Pholiota conissans]
MASQVKGKDGVFVLEHHPKYYIDAADLHIVTNKTLFRVHGYFFSRESPLFNKKLNPASPGDVRQGTNDSDPIVLEDVKPEEFEKLLWVFYNPKYSLYEASVDDWNCILNLADRWDFNEVKELAVRELQKKRELDIVTKMALYQKYKVDQRHLVPLYAALCKRDIPLTLEEAKVIGLEASILVNNSRERLRAKPSDGGRSPLPDGMEEADVFHTLEAQIGLQEGATAKFMAENMPSASLESRTWLVFGLSLLTFLLLLLSLFAVAIDLKRIRRLNGSKPKIGLNTNPK